MAAHPPSSTILRASLPVASSGQAPPRHMEVPAYRCFLPDLTGFTGFHCAGPGHQRRTPADGLTGRPLGRGFSPAVADCGYRAPLAPRLARPPRVYPRARSGSNVRRDREEGPSKCPEAGLDGSQAVTSSSSIRSSAPSPSDRWPSSCSRCSEAPGSCAASQLAVGEGHHEIGRSLPDHGRGRDLAEVEAPRLGERQVVIEPSVDTPVRRPSWKLAAMSSPNSPVRDGLVHVGQQRLERGDDVGERWPPGDSCALATR